MDLLLNVSGH
jgi:hypothetical protein